MSRAQHDQVIDDEEPETCPLCIEEFDLSDKGFFPCPCGYQICQFCHNNIKTTMNGLCPACRRPYSDSNIRIVEPSQEEVAKYKEGQAQQAKRRAAARQKEAQKRQADNFSRKELAGVRVRRQNLVYVTGVKLNTSDPQLSERLRGDQFFGQYGKIDKIVVNKPKDSRMVQPVGIYITYFRKDDAALCIQMVNGHQSNGNVMKADYGTTKYCSAYIRGETCNNKNCTFLHEAGDETESYTREQLSAMNAASSAQHNQPPPAPQHSHTQPVTANPATAQQSEAMERQDSKDEASSPIESSDGSALPSTASWANVKNSAQHESQPASVASPSPLITNVVPSQAPEANKNASIASPSVQEPNQHPYSSDPWDSPALDAISATVRSTLSYIAGDRLKFVFDENSLSPSELQFIKSFPPWFDPNGGAKRLLRKRQEAERRRAESEKVATQALSGMDLGENAEGGSLQLGGEPEDHHDLDAERHRQAIQPSGQDSLASPDFSSLTSAFSPTQTATTNGRIVPPQQQQYLLQQLNSASPNFLTRNQGNPTSQSMAQPQQSQSSTGGQLHARQASRFSFANDTSASASVKPVANQNLMKQQSSMMPPQHGNSFGAISQHQAGSQFFASGVQGPPPGLRATGTPPVSGGGMFGQGHGFATAGLGYGVNSSGRNANDELMRELLRNRGGSAGGGQASEGSRRESTFPSLPYQHSQSSTPPAPGLSSFPYGPQPGAFQDHGPQKQKKKGKKHRHANTSSSGGGVVDLADPSVLQARMHQAGGTGQGLYNAQSQGQAPFDQIKPSTIDSRVRKGRGLPSYITQTISTGSPNQSRPLSPSTAEQEYGGLVALDSSASNKISSEQADPTTLSLRQSETTQRQPPHTVGQLDGKGQSESATPSTLLQDEAFPELPKPRQKQLSTVQSAPQPKQTSRDASQHNTPPDRVPSGSVQGDQSKASPDVGGKPISMSTKRQAPGKLDIAAATNMNTAEQAQSSTYNPSSKPETPLHPVRVASDTPGSNSRPSTPGNQLDTPSKRTGQPRTLKVVDTPKLESPSGVPSEPAKDALQSPRGRSAIMSSKPTSRQSSLASAAAPGTPAGGKMSDNVSVTTGSASRAASPAPSKVGSAPTRTQTKSQQKKSRQERAKAAEAEKREVESAQAAAEVVQEPIVGRKKKTKKPAASATVSTPGVSQPTSKPASPAPVKEETPEPTQEPPSAKAESDDALVIETSKEEQVEDKPTPTIHRKATLSPTTIVSDLQESAAFDPATLQFFKHAGSLSARVDISTADVSNMALQPPLTTAELAQLDAGEPVRRAASDQRDSLRLLITPARKCLRGLSREMEDRYLEIEKRVRETKPPVKFAPRRAKGTEEQLRVDEILEDMAATLTRPPTTTGPIASQKAASDENANAINAAKLAATAQSIIETSGDDALAFLDQFILPPVPSRSGGSNGTRKGSIGSAIPRTYTTGNPTYSVSGLGDAAYNSSATTPILSNDNKSAAMRSLEGIDGSGGAATIKQALVHAMNGVVGAAAAAAAAAAVASAGGGEGSGMEVSDAEEVEKALALARKECESLEKKLLQLMKKNKRFAGIN